MPQGRYTHWTITPEGLWIPEFSKNNSLMTTWGFAAAMSLGFGDRRYRINKIYVEFENVEAEEDPVSVPDFVVTEGREYYNSLVTPRDYLRINLDGNPTLQIAPGYEDYFTDGLSGNKLLFRGQTVGTEGVNGVPFSSAALSKVFGVALVAAPVDADPTQDVIVARGYYEVAKQKIKQASTQIGITWEMVFPPVT